MAHVGEIARLVIKEIDPSGAVLDNDHKDVFLAGAECAAGLKAGDEIEVYLFINKDRVLEATTTMPEIKLNEAGGVKIKTVTDLGAFVNIGAPRDILIPAKEMRRPFLSGDYVVVLVKYDKSADKLYATTRYGQHLQRILIPYKRGEKLNVLVAERIDNARRVIVENRFLGVISDQDVLSPIRVGDRCVAYVRKIEAGEVHMSTQKEGKELIEDAKTRILDTLDQNKGYLRITDNTPPDEIKLRLKMNKTTFKQAIATLSEEGKIVLTKRGIKQPKA